jgi:pilus assembly protein Flp/PilA
VDQVDPIKIGRPKGHIMKNVLLKLWKEESGQDLVEYVLLATLVSLSAMAIMGTFASAISQTFTKAAVEFMAAI